VPIEFNEAECAEIIDRVGISAAPEAAARLALALSSSTQYLVEQLQKAPFPDRTQVRHKVDHLSKPLRDFLKYYGIDINLSTGRAHLNNTSKWFLVLQRFSAYPNHDRPRDLEEKMARVARLAHTLYDEIAEFDKYLDSEAGIPGKESLNSRKAITGVFIQAMVRASAALFTEPLTVSNDRDLQGRDVHGPAITYLQACLGLLQKRLNDAGFQHIAEDHPLKISANTLSRWFYEVHENQ
jgi:hypothetical protein